MVKGLNRVRRNLQQGRRLGRKAFKHGSGTTPREAAEIMNHKAEAGEKGLLNRSNANVHGDRVDPEDEEQMELLRSRKKNLILRRATVGKNSALRFGVEISKKKQKVLLKAAKREAKFFGLSVAESREMECDEEVEKKQAEPAIKPMETTKSSSGTVLGKPSN